MSAASETQALHGNQDYYHDHVPISIASDQHRDRIVVSIAPVDPPDHADNSCR